MTLKTLGACFMHKTQVVTFEFELGLEVMLRLKAFADQRHHPGVI